MDYESARDLAGMIEGRLGDVASSLAELVEIGKTRNERFANQADEAQQFLSAVRRLVGDGRPDDIAVETTPPDPDAVDVAGRLERFRLDTLSTVGSIKSRLDALWSSNADAWEGIDRRFISVNDRLDALEKERVQLPNAAIAELRKAIQAQDVAIQGLTNRLEANEQAVQSCLSTLDELNKMVRTIAGKLPPDRPHIQFPQPIP